MNLLRQHEYFVWMDQGAPPLMDVNTTSGFDDPYQWGFSMVLRWSEHLDPSDGVEIDIMIEAKMKEQAIFKLYEKYPILNCKKIFIKKKKS